MLFLLSHCQLPSLSMEDTCQEALQFFFYINHIIYYLKSIEEGLIALDKSKMRETPTKAGKLGLKLIEDLTALAAGGSAIWLRVGSVQRTFALDLLEFILSDYAAVFRTLLLMSRS